MTLSEIADNMAVFFFDMRTLHFNTKGEEFYRFHEVAEDLYSEAEDFYDDLVETAIGYGEYVGSMATSCVRVDWIPLEPSEVSTTNSAELILETLNYILDILNRVDDYYDSFVYSKIDEIKDFFNKELYKVNQVLKK